MPLSIIGKKLSGSGMNTALWCYFEMDQARPVQEIEVKDAVFTDLFFDQSNLVYIHIGKDSRSMMLNKDAPTNTVHF